MCAITARLEVPAGEGSQQFIQALLKFPIPFCLFVFALQFLKRGHQRLGYVPSPVDAKAPLPACSGPTAIVDGRGCHIYARLSVARTALMNAFTFAASFLPGRDSTPEETSTPHG